MTDSAVIIEDYQQDANPSEEDEEDDEQFLADFMRQNTTKEKGIIPTYRMVN